MFCLMFRQLSLAREKSRETSRESAGSWLLNWSIGHFNCCFIQRKSTLESEWAVMAADALKDGTARMITSASMCGGSNAKAI